MKKKLIVKTSVIHGKGLFASNAIKKGAHLGLCKVEKTIEPGDYTLWLNEKKTVDVTCKFKYINHNKKPNVVYYDDLTVVALRDIKPGDELTHYYGKEWDDK